MDVKPVKNGRPPFYFSVLLNKYKLDVEIRFAVGFPKADQTSVACSINLLKGGGKLVFLPPV